MQLLWLVPALPLLGALVLALAGGAIDRRASAAVGCASVGLSCLVSLAVAGSFVSTHAFVFHQVLFPWVTVGSLQVGMGLWLDQLSLVMMAVITVVSFLIHLYSTEFMNREADYSLFFCYMNLFVGSMLVLVLGDSLLSLYLGWEGVGLCSYLLIGFWYRDRSNGVAAQKAFIVTRVGDTALAIGLFLLFWKTGTLDIRQAMQVVGAPEMRAVALAAGLLLLGGAVGKSAQIPLHTWLPDAMAGPTPVSALIHAATMVTAGVYLIARTNAIYRAAPAAMLVVAVVGAATALYGALCALPQRDIKRVLAYSTISQVGYMMLALGVGAWSAAIFHFVTHAFFKALLFLSAGIAVQALGEERDVYRMGGLFRRLPWAGWTFLIGAASLSALPLVTAGFYSKDRIIWASWSSDQGSAILGAAAFLASFLTAIYIFRVFFLVFLGQPRHEIERLPGAAMKLAVAALSFFAMTAGFLGMPQVLGGFSPLLGFLSRTVGASTPMFARGEAGFLVLSALETLAAIWFAYALFIQVPSWVTRLADAPSYQMVRRLALAGMGFDSLYDRVIVRPYVAAARLNRGDFVDVLYSVLALFAWMSNRALSATESGRVRNYATGLLLGAVLVTVLLLLR
jgi:NADH-quinone oxidoreductase subunit L